MSSLQILLFDDIVEHLTEVHGYIAAALGQDGRVVSFPLLTTADKSGGEPRTFEKRLEEILSPDRREISLIVADRDLSRATNFIGLSEPTIRRVCDVIGVPECGYARGETEDILAYVELGDKREECIRLALNPYERFAAQVVDIAKSFAWLEAKVAEVVKGVARLSPAKLLANVLGAPDQVEKIALFAVGDKNRLGDIPRWRKAAPDEQHRRLACMLGYWLWDSVLFFPGLVVNDVAASSYLNIELNCFRTDHKVQAVFESARYNGPFSVARGPLWWRGKLDEIVSQSELDDGRAMASTTLNRDIPQSQCCVDPTISAGFVCMLSNKPVSSKHSTGNVLWLPRGADLARASHKMLDDVGPWL
jgi:hypothetical protein